VRTLSLDVFVYRHSWEPEQSAGEISWAWVDWGGQGWSAPLQLFHFHLPFAVANRFSCLFPDYFQMALDGKAIIKEEITDKDAYDAAAAAAVAAGAALAVATAAAVQVPPTSSSAAGSASAAAAAATNNNTNTTSAAATAAAISRRLKGEWSILRGNCTGEIFIAITSAK